MKNLLSKDIDQVNLFQVFSFIYCAKLMSSVFVKSVALCPMSQNLKDGLHPLIYLTASSGQLDCVLSVIVLFITHRLSTM